MEGLDVDDLYEHYRLDPSHQDAVTYFLPRLISGEPLHGAEKLIHRVDVYDCEPKDLAAQFAPVPQAVSTGDRFFFTTCKLKSKNGRKTQSVRSAGGGTWTVNTTSKIEHAGCEVGEVTNLAFKKNRKSTGWIMEEYRCFLPEATVADEVKVFCKIHLAQHPPAEARQESAAYKRQESQPQPVTASTHAHKRAASQPEHAQKKPAPVAAADPHPPRPTKRMRVAVPVPEPAIAYEDCPVLLEPVAPVSLPAASMEGSAVPEADDDMSRFFCSMEELLGVQEEETLPVEAEKNVERSVAPLEEPQSFYWEPEELQRLLAEVNEAVAEQQRQAVSTSDKPSMEQEVGNYMPPPSLFDPFEEPQAKDAIQGIDFCFNPFEKSMVALENEKRCNAPADLQTPSLQGHEHLFRPLPSFFDPFATGQWPVQAEGSMVGLENQKRYNVTANLQARPLGGHNSFFSPASVH